MLIDVVLLITMVKGIVSIMLAFKDLRQDALGACRLSSMVNNMAHVIRALDAHSSSMNAIKLILDVVVPRRSLAL